MTTATPETLTRAMVDSLLESAHPNGEGLDPNHPPDRVLAKEIRTWKRWDAGGRDHDEYNARRAARAICDRINYLDAAKVATPEETPRGHDGEEG